MDTDTVADIAMAQDDTQKLREAMRACQPDRQALIDEVAPLFRQLWAEALTCLETALPDHREPGSADAKLHSALRNRILNAGNSKAREFQTILNNYLLTQVFKREVVTRIQMPSYGIHNLPVGVKMPEPRP